MSGKKTLPGEGWDNILAQTTINRAERPTTGKGNDLPEASRYVVITPNPQYTGITMRLAFQNGRAETDDRELAWVLKSDFKYAVEPVA